MATNITEDVYNGRDNKIALMLTEDGESINHTSITRVQLYLNDSNDTVVDSDYDAGVFDWSTNKLEIALGMQGIPEGSYACDLYVYDGTNINGIAWEPKLGIRVHAEV